MDLAAALRWLDEHVNLEASPAIAGRVEGLSLDRMQVLCEILGDPQHAQPALHLTGTNGKGSTARILSAILSAHDVSTGTYTSPHLEQVNERIARDGTPIGDGDLAAVLSDLATLEPLLPERPSYFELLTGAALRWFAEVAVDAAVLEVGLLGRWDATNVVDGDVAVLTNVGRDHTDGAEGWKQEVAAEKAGIVKPGATFVVGEPSEALRAVFEATPAAELLVVGRDFLCEADELAVGGRRLSIKAPRASYQDLFLPAHGPHQAANATLAVVAAEAFFGRAMDLRVIQDGLAAVELPGRFEIVHRSPLVVLDGAHNAAGAQALARTLEEGFATGGTVRLVVGTLAGRDPAALLEPFELERAAEVITCTPPSPRALPAEELARAVEAAGATARAIPDVADALRRALDAAAPSDTVVVTGSLYTVGEARAACRALGLI